MIRHVMLFLIVLGIFFLNFNFNGGVSLMLTVSNEIDAGTDVRVQVTINKGDLVSFARFQQELPKGLTASGVNSANADFSFKDNKVKFIWLRLPDEEVFTISYIIHVNRRLKGNFDLGGKFSYIENNERRIQDIESELITILPLPSIDQSLIVDIADFEEILIPQPVEKEIIEVVCIRQKPYLSGNENEIIVNILVNKGGTEKFTKIEEKIPEGYSAVSTQSKNAIFTFKDQTVKYLWMNLPAEPYYIVSYTLIPDTNIQADHVMIDGLFSYIEDDKTHSIDIVEKDIELLNITSDDLLAIVSAIPGKSEEIATEFAVQDVVDQIITVKTDEIIEKPEISYILEPKPGVYYRVQIAAGHKPVNIKRYFNKYNVKEEIRTEMHEGWHKYSIGSFSVYKDARDYRVKIRNSTTIDDAFVSAYNSGVRTTVQEALMIANQKWYR